MPKKSKKREPARGGKARSLALAQEREPRWVLASRVFALLALCLPVVLFPLALRTTPDQILDLLSPLPGGEALAHVLMPLLFFGLTPLILKESFTSLAMLLAVACWGTHLLLSSPLRRHPARPAMLLFLCFVAWSLLSTLWAPHFGLDSDSTYTAYNLAVWAVFAMALLCLPDAPRFERIVVRCIVALGVLIMGISAMQATWPFSEGVFKVLNAWPGPHNRSLYGSLIGHNTGAAVVGMGPFFFLLGGLFSARSTRSRVALFAGVVLGAYFFFVTKSRFAWLALAVLVPLFLIGLRLLVGSPVRLRHILIGLLLLLTLGGVLIVRPGSGLERADYIVRIQSLRPSVLLQGTRLRILAVSAPLVAEKPIMGHGLGGFSSVYPAAQADYFEKNPGTRLEPTEALTRRAHNDYLQVLVETGVIGLGLLAATLFLFLRQAVRALMSETDPDRRLRRYCALFGVVAILLHALIDFPFHIAPLATLFVFFAFLVRPVAETASPSVPDEAESAPPAWWGAPSARVARVAAIVALWGVLAFATHTMATRVGADAQAKPASDLLYRALGPKYSAHPEERARMLNQAAGKLSEALRLDPRSFEARFDQGRCQFELADIQSAASRKAYQSGQQKQAREAHGRCLQHLAAAREAFLAASHMARGPDGKDLPVGQRLNHKMLFYLARTEDLAAKMIPNDRSLARRAVRYWEETVRYSPGNPRFIMALLGHLDPDDASLAGKRKEYVRLLARYNPDAVFDKFLGHATRLVNAGSPALASRLLREVVESVETPSDYMEVFKTLAGIYLFTDDDEGFRWTLDAMREVFPGDPEVAKAEFTDLVRSEKFEEAESILSTLPQADHVERQYWEFARAELLLALGREEESRAVSREVLRRSINPAKTYTLRGIVRETVFRNPAGALGDYHTASLYYPRAFSAQSMQMLVRGLLSQGRRADAGIVLHLAREDIPKHASLRQLQAEYEQR